MDDPKSYYFASGNEQRGPYALNEFLALGLRPDTLVWREGMSEWQRLDMVPELIAAMQVGQLSASAPTIARQPAPIAPLENSQQLSYRGFDPGAIRPASGMAVASMVLGIVAVVSLCLGILSAIGLPCSILAIVFGFIARGKANRNEAGGRGMALAGIILGFVHLGVITLLLSALLGFRLLH